LNSLLNGIVKPISKPVLAEIPRVLVLEREDKYIPYYHDYFFVDKSHALYFGRDEKKDAVIVAVNTVSTGRDKYRTLYMNHKVFFFYFFTFSFFILYS